MEEEQMVELHLWTDERDLENWRKVTRDRTAYEGVGRSRERIQSLSMGNGVSIYAEIASQVGDEGAEAASQRGCGQLALFLYASSAVGERRETSS